MVPTDWTPAGFTGIARREATGRLVLNLAPTPGERPRQARPVPAAIDLELLACARRLIAHTAAHYRRTGWLSVSGPASPEPPAHYFGLTLRARRTGECSHRQTGTGDSK